MRLITQSITAHNSANNGALQFPFFIFEFLVRDEVFIVRRGKAVFKTSGIGTPSPKRTQSLAKTRLERIYFNVKPLIKPLLLQQPREKGETEGTDTRDTMPKDI